jgi:LPS-assembly protein
MNVRSLVSNMLAVVCHCLIAGQLFAIQIPAPPDAAKSAEDVTISVAPGGKQEKTGSLFHLQKDVEIDFRNYVLHADEITYNSDTGEANASGHVELQGGDEDLLIKASHGNYNVKTESGKFYDVIGSAGMQYHGGPHVALTTANPFVFRGKEVEKIGKSRYILLDGLVTSCTLPDPKWSFRSGKVDFTLGDTAKMYHATFRLRDIPVLYLPFVEHPAEAFTRQSGFLVPTIGESSRKGWILGDSYYWAINRSMDATVGGEYFSTRGWAQHATFRARPSADSNVEFTYFGVIDRGFPTTLNGVPFLQNQGGEDATLVAKGLALPFGFQGGVNAEYLSRYLFREAWGETFSQAVNSEVKSSAYATKAFDGYDLSVFARRYQNFQSTAPDDVVQILHTPSVDFSSANRRLFGPLHLGFDTAAEGLQRSQPAVLLSPTPSNPFQTNGLVGRFDLAPHLNAPIFLRGWTFRPEIAVRDTYYSQRLLGNGTPSPTTGGAINRRALTAEFELRPPTLVRVFDKPVFGRKIKHTIEVNTTYRKTSGIDNFLQIIRFDERDILSDTNEIEYGFTQRLYTKRNEPTGNCDETYSQEEKEKAGCLAAREFVTWQVAQKYYFDPTFGGAVVPGIRNVFTTSEDLTGIAFITGPRTVSPVVSRLRVRSTDKTSIEWAVDYDPHLGQLNSSNFIIDHKLDAWTLGASQTILRAPGEFTTNGTLVTPAKFNQYRLLAAYGSPSKPGFSLGGNIGVDTILSNIQYSTVQTSYNWDCCGISFEYRRFGLGTTVRNENQFRFAFTLANIGTFGNMRRQERLF